MASLRKHPKSNYWFACITLPDGRRTQRSTKETDRRKAQKIAEAFEAATRKARTETQARKVVSDIYELINGQPLATLSIQQYFTEWTATVATTTSKATAAAYAQVSRDFIAFLGERANRDLSQLSSVEITQFRTATLARVSVSTANKTLKILRVALSQAVKNGLIDNNPAARVDTVRAKASDKNDRRPFTLDELRRVLAVCNNEWRGMVIAGLYTGQRLGDLANLTWSSVDLARGEISFVTAKTGRRQLLPIAKPLHAYLETLPSSDNPRAPIFPKLCQSRRLSNDFHDILVDADLVAKRSDANTDGTGQGRKTSRQAGGLSFHCLRHTATTLLKTAGVSQAVVMDLIGHDSPEISRHYTHVDADAKRSALEKIPDIVCS